MSRIDEILNQPRMLDRSSDETGQNARPLYEMICKYFAPGFTVVEIGSYSGGSTELFALTCAKVYSIDPYEASGALLQEGPTEEQARSNLLAAERVFVERMSSYSHVTKIRELSEQAIGRFADESIDAVYIDGNHRYENVVADIKLWGEKVRPGGIISGHDYGGHVAQAITNTIGVPFEVFSDSSWVFVKGKKNPRQFYIKLPTTNGRLGLMAQVLSTMGLLAAKKTSDSEILVDLRGEDVYSNSRNPNTWESFFEQPSLYALHHVEKASAMDQVVIERSQFNEHAGTFGFFEGTHDWPLELVQLSRSVASYIRPRGEIRRKIDAFYSAFMAGKRVVGIQSRNTDLWASGHAKGQMLPIDVHFKELDALLPNYDAAFLVTDSFDVVYAFKSRYGHRLIHYDDVTLSSHGLSPHCDTSIDNYKKGEDVIIETWLLSRCQFLLAMSSNISCVARALNKELSYRYIDKSIIYE